jgi:hypothetical protein
MLEEPKILLSLQETDLEVREVKLAEEQAWVLYSFDRQDLPVELEELHTCTAGVTDEWAAKAGKLSTLVMGISNALVNLEMLLIWDIPQHPKMAQEVLAVAGLIWHRSVGLNSG